MAAVRSAEALGAASTPVAAYQLELANGELRQAETLMHDGHNEQARDALECAKADADLAMALRREDEARVAAAHSHEQIDQLRTGEGVVSTTGAPSPVTAPSVVTRPTTAATEHSTTTTTTVTTGHPAQ